MSGRYVKINYTTNWGDASWVIMSIIHVCDADGVKWNDGTMTYTSSTDGYEGYGLPGDVAQATEQENVFWMVRPPGFDGNTPNPGWWKVDLGVSRLISKIKLRTYNGYDFRNIKDFTVEVSDNDVDWTEILSAQTLLNEYNPQVQEFEISNVEEPHLSEPPVVALIVTPHVPLVAMMRTAIIPIAALLFVACTPNFMIPIAFVPVIPLTLSIPQNTETGNIISLLNFNDTPGGETVTDETGRSWTVPHPAVPTETAYPNNAEISADGPMTGMGSLSLPSSISYILTPFTADLDIGSQDFTFECWHKCIDIPNSMAPFLSNNSGTPYPVESGLHIAGSGGYATALLGFTDDTYVYLSDIQPLRAEWKHFAIVRRGNTVYGFDHGVKTVTEVIDPESNGILNPPLNGFVIGANLGYSDGKINGMPFFGNISGVKLTVGHGKWIDDFTPSSTPYEHYEYPLKSYARSVAGVAELTLTTYSTTSFGICTTYPPVAKLSLGCNVPSITGYLANQYTTFPNLSGNHLTLNFHSSSLTSGLELYYMRTKTFKTIDRVDSKAKHPNLSGKHLSLKFSHSALEDLILLYTSVGIVEKIE